MLTKTKDELESPRNYERLNNPEYNKGTAFTDEERDRYGLRGLMPTGVSSSLVQQERAMSNLRRKAYDIDLRVRSMVEQRPACANQGPFT